MPLLDDDLAVYFPNDILPYYQQNIEAFTNSRMPRIFDGDLEEAASFVALNRGVSYGRLRQLSADDRPHPRDIVIYEALPNELPPVAGIVSTAPQTPLSHVNLRAAQNGIPNTFSRDALDDPEITALVGEYVRYEVTEDGYTLRAATKPEVDAHYASSRPAQTQTPQRDLSVTTITPLSEVGFDDWDAFGVKAANVAVLGTLGFREGTVPDGFAIPFYFYDRFMKETALGEETVLGKKSAPAEEKITLPAETTLAEAVTAMLAHPHFRSDYDIQEEMLDDLRDAIKDATSPQFIIDALTAMHATYPEGQSLRYRSSTNNEDLPGFNGAGLYDSKTQKPEETEEDGIDKSLKQVYASLWNFRAFSERDFHRVDHMAVAMGVLVHPNYTDELANGVAVSFNPYTNDVEKFYANTQLGEDLVTNPEVHSVPEELLLDPNGAYLVLSVSNLVEPGKLLMNLGQMRQLGRHLATIHNHFKGLYDPGPGEPFAMEIEFKITSEDILAIKQARPWLFGDAGAPDAPPPNTTGVGSGPEDEQASVPAAPVVHAVHVISEDSVFVEWRSDDEDDSITAYRILRGTSEDSLAEIEEDTGLELTGPGWGIYEDIAPPPGRTVWYAVQARNAAGLSPRSNAFEAAIPGEAVPDPDPPAAPTGLTGTAEHDRVTLAWDDPGDDSITGYQVLRGDSEDSLAVIEEDTGSTETTYADTDPPAGQTVWYAVQARNANGLSPRSNAFEVAIPPNAPDVAPTISGTARVGETLTAHIPGIDDEKTDLTLAYQWLADDTDIPDATASTYTVSEDDVGKTISVRVTATDDQGNEASMTSDATEPVAPRANNPATGAPSISGAALVGEILTAHTSDIADANGLTNAVFTYQWKRIDPNSTDTEGENIPGATGQTYTVTSDDLTRTLRVVVSFTDDAGFEESLTSAATTVLEALSRPYGLTAVATDGAVVLTWTAPGVVADDLAGLSDYQILRHRPELGEAEPLVHVSYTYSDATTYIDEDVEPGVLYVYRVRAADFFGIVGEASDPVEIRTPEPMAPRPNTPATGAPTISGAAQPGETLTSDTSAIADDDGLTDAAFTYQWIRHDVATTTDTDIDGATGSTYTVTAGDEGHGLRVRVTFTDDAGNEESLTSDATAAVKPLFTASFHDAPDAHDGTNTFTFELRFSENIPISYRTLRDHAFTVTGGEVTGARRLVRSGDSRNLRWEITVRPDGNGAVTIVLPATGDCNDDGAICTSDGRKLSNRLELVVPGPGG